MKKTIARLEKYRDTWSLDCKSSEKDGHNGRFFLPPSLVGRSYRDGGGIPKSSKDAESRSMTIIISDASRWDADLLGPVRWEHVSASWPDRIPTWSEMCRVKDLFWREDEAVIQFHPPKRDYVNHHKYCLHLWKPIDCVIPMPPSLAVGPKDVQPLRVVAK